MPQPLAPKCDVASQLHRQRAGPGISEVTLQHVIDERDENPRNVEPDMVEKVAVLGGDNGVPQPLWNVVVADDDAAFGGKLADQLTTARVDAGDGARSVVIQLEDDGQVGRVGEEAAGENPKQRSDGERANRSGPRIVDSVLSEISTGFQAAVLTATCSKYTASGVRRSSAV